MERLAVDQTAEKIIDLLDRRADLVFTLVQRRTSPRQMSGLVAARQALFETTAAVLQAGDIDALPSEAREPIMKTVKALIRDIDALAGEITATDGDERSKAHG